MGQTKRTTTQLMIAKTDDGNKQLNNTNRTKIRVKLGRRGPCLVK